MNRILVTLVAPLVLLLFARPGMADTAPLTTRPAVVAPASAPATTTTTRPSTTTTTVAPEPTTTTTAPAPTPPSTQREPVTTTTLSAPEPGPASDVTLSGHYTCGAGTGCTQDQGPDPGPHAYTGQPGVTDPGPNAGSDTADGTLSAQDPAYSADLNAKYCAVKPWMC